MVSQSHGIITQIIHDLGNWSIPQDCIPKCTLKLVTCIKEHKLKSYTFKEFHKHWQLQHVLLQRYNSYIYAPIGRAFLTACKAKSLHYTTM
ncbi:hypothetical protein T01_2852 [Trichinella spiralis]|uniref:Uncharacterized protein n=1 Tax=Trichinella spiralis TaxID=6334 RepID=A0A0V1C2P0_TRISP|nr:hypothetical protein T01_2852 [Trichinella spiralis]